MLIGDFISNRLFFTVRLKEDYLHQFFSIATAKITKIKTDLTLTKSLAQVPTLNITLHNVQKIIVV